MPTARLRGRGHWWCGAWGQRAARKGEGDGKVAGGMTTGGAVSSAPAATGALLTTVPMYQ
eukprot:364118-Chlamydomonas_euryale.AAC.4